MIERSIVPPIHARARAAAGIVRVVVHHGGDSPAPAEHKACVERVRSYDLWHREGRGWAGLGYHRIGCAHGVVWEGRPLLMVGAHSEPANVDGIGYCYIGGNEPMPALALNAFAAAIRQDAAQLGRPLTVWGHGAGRPAVEPGTTVCPGPGIAGQLEELRALIAAPAAGPVNPSPSPAPAPERPPAGRTDTEAIVRQLPTLRRGDGSRARPHPHVRIAQALLNAHGAGAGVVDGIAGPLFDTAVRRFQRSRRLTVDGIIGRQTWPALLDVS